MSVRTEDVGEWDSEAAYEYVRRRIVANQGHERPTDAPIAERLRIRKTACDTGPLAVETFETALAALREHEPRLAVGEDYIGIYPTDDLACEAIGWVAEREQPDRAFIGAVNGVLDS